MTIVPVLGGRRFAWVVVLMLMSEWAHEANSQNARDAFCGPRCLAFILRQMGRDIEDHEKFVAVMRTHPDTGVSLQDLREVSEQRGLHTIPVEASLRWISSLLNDSTYAILWTANHFQILSKMGDTTYLIDPSRRSIVLLDESMDPSRKWKALLIFSGEICLPMMGSSAPTDSACRHMIRWMLVTLLIVGTVVFWKCLKRLQFCKITYYGNRDKNTIDHGGGYRGEQ